MIEPAVSAAAEPREERKRVRIEAPWLILAALLSATVLSAYQSQRQLKAEAETRFTELANGGRLELFNALHSDEDVLRSAAALLVAVPNADARRWEEYFDARLENAGERPGLLAVQYISAPGEGANAVPTIRLQKYFSSLSDQVSWPAIPEPVLRIITRASGKGQALITASFGSAREPTSRYVAMVIPVLPTLQGQAPGVRRGAQVSGYLVGYIRMSDLAGTVIRQTGRKFSVSIFDGEEELAVGDAAPRIAAGTRQLELGADVGRREWRFRVRSTPALDEELTSRTPGTILLIGGMGTVLLAGLVWLLTRLRAQAESLADAMTVKLRDHVKFTEDLIEFNPNPIFRIDAEGRFVSVNRAWEQLSSRDRRDVLGKTYADFLGPTMAAQNEAHDRELLHAPGGHATHEMFITNLHGDRFETIVSKQVVRRSDGAIDGLIGTITDVTPIKRLEREVARQREQLDMVIVSSQQGIWDIELKPNGAQYFSDRFREMLGYEKSNFPVRVDWEQFMHPDFIVSFREQMILHFKGESPLFDHESRIRRRDGEYFWVRTRAIAQRAADGRAQRFVGSIVDITDRKLAEAKLIEASERVAEAARSKESFLATMSHEIRTPLNGVLGMTGLLSETELNDEQRDYIRLIRASGDTLLRLIDDVLDFSKIESGRMTLESVPVEVVPLAEEAFELVAEKAREKRLALILDIADSVPFYLMGDATRLRQILLNLLSNAIKFTAQGEVMLSLEASAPVDGRFVLSGRVKDTGIGIPASRIGQLFQPFTQVDASTTRKYGGTGLGLAIVKRLVMQMGGSIHVESVEGEGATFKFSIATQVARGPLRPYMQRDVFDMLGKRVLVIDRTERRRPILERRYRRWGLEATMGAPEQAAELLRAGPAYDILISDTIFTDEHTERLHQAMLADDDYRAQHNQPRMVSILTSSLSRAELSQQHITPLLRHEMFVVRPAGHAKMFDVLTRAALHQPSQDVATRPFTPEPVYEREYHSSDPRSQQRRQAMDGNSAQAKSRRENASGRSLSLLVAEDNEINQRVIQGMLNNLGHQPHMVSNGRAAVDAALGTRFDAVLMDIHMPELDGLGAMAEIRNQLGAHSPPIAAMTAHALAGDRERYLSEGMDDYISKPIRSADLVQLLERMVPPSSEGGTPNQEPARTNSRQTPAHTPAAPAAPAPAASITPPRPDIDAMPVLDKEQLEDLRYLPDDSEDGDSVGSLIQLFQTKAAERMEIMHECLAQADWLKLAETAHSLRGASASMGFPRVASLCKDLELSARAITSSGDEPDQERLDNIFEQIQLRYREADAALTEWLAKPADAG